MLPNIGESLAKFTFSIEYQKERDNLAADILSQVTLKLDAEIMKFILEGVTMGMTERMDAQNPAVAKADQHINKPIQETVVLARAAQTCVDLHVTDWMTAQQEDPILKNHDWVDLWMESTGSKTPAGRWHKNWG